MPHTSKMQFVETFFVQYKFPVILNIADVLPFIEGKEEFKVMDRGDHLTIDYLFVGPNTFPAILTLEEATRENTVLRECRGLIFDKDTGKIIRRGPHKFFNHRERDETSWMDYPTFNSNYVLLEKLDGSLIAPFKNSEGRMIWGTMAGETDYSEFVNAFVAYHPQYVEVANFLIDNGWTPAFEFCSRKNKVVVDHPVDRLVLHTVRHMISGEYLPIEQVRAFSAYGVEVVDIIEFEQKGKNDNFAHAFRAQKEWVDTEGFIVRFDSGHMVKLKTDWYCNLHGCVTGIRFEKDVVAIIFNNRLDDLIPFLTEDMIERMEEYSVEVNDELSKTTDYIVTQVQDCLNKEMDRKAIASRYNGHPFFLWIMQCYVDATENRREKMSDTLHTMTFRRLRKLIGEHTFSQSWIDRYRFLYGNKRFII